jgi:hypothetical protein
MTVSVKIKNRKARRILEDLASLDLIEITAQEKSVTNKLTTKEKTLTHIASENSLTKTWSNSKEDEAWQDL